MQNDLAQFIKKYDSPANKYKADAILKQLLKDKTTSDMKHSLHRYFNTADLTNLEPYALYLGAITLEQTKTNIKNAKRPSKKLKKEEKIARLLQSTLKNSTRRML